MQLRYVFNETGNGLKRNVTMTIALVVTIFVSLTLVGMGLLLNAQAQKAEKYWGSKLQITAYLCNQNSRSPHCTSGEVDDAQRTAIEGVLKTHPEVAKYRFETKQQAFDTWKRVYISKDKSEQEIYSTVTPDDMRESYWITLKDPNKFRGVESALAGMDGVDSVRDLRDVLDPIYQVIKWMKWGALITAAFLLVAAMLQVGNTIRLAVLARRREIGIMRLVGASNLYISLPFLLEMLVAALVGVVLASGLIGGFMFLVYQVFRNKSHIVEWIAWSDALSSVLIIGALGVVITLVPTLVMTRKYLKV
ncbi:MAG: permease-like cell division protein FtsX [Nocardioidaceae bacterium]|nr:permease-like cell division protein FtsX [Nocardioidaceae bacterium]